jgi:hypothetical protein
VFLRADGWTYCEIVAFLDVSVRVVRHELEQAARNLSDPLDAGAPMDELSDYLDALAARADWLQARMRLAERAGEAVE